MERSVPNPAKERAKHTRDMAATVVNTAGPGEIRFVPNAEVNRINALLVQAEQALRKATKTWEKIPARLPLGEVNPEQLIVETEHR